MTSYLRINHFISSANQSINSSECLVANPHQVSVSLTSSLDNAEQNKQTWQVFKQDLIETIGKRKFEWICQRYRSQIHFAALEKSGRPLLPEHVELFSIGSSQLLGRDIKDKESTPIKLKTLTRAQLKSKISLAQPFPIVGSFRDPVKISGSPGNFLALFIHDKVLMDKEKQLLLSDVEHLSFPAWLERFCKSTVNRELLEGQLIPAPGTDGQLDYYKVYRKIAGEGLVSYALKPLTSDSTLKPLVIFRPSQWALSNEDAFETYLNDVQLSVGELGWKANEQMFDQLMNDPHSTFLRPDQKVSIAGYSLGGVHAQRFLAVHHAKVSGATFHSDPSIDETTVDQFAETINQLPVGFRTEPLNIQIFRMKRDVAHYVGGKHIGWGVNHPDVNVQLLEIDHENKQISAFYLHSHRIFDNTSFPYQMQRYENTEALFNHLDNSKRGADVWWYENMRRVWGTVAYVSFYCLAQAIRTISWVFGVEILRKSRSTQL